MGNCVLCGKLAVRGTERCEEHYLKLISHKYLSSSKYWILLKELLIKQDYLCVYTGTKLIPGVNTSLDHIVPKSKGGGNVIGNFQWVTIQVNFAKLNYTDEEFLSLIKSVYKYRKLGGC
jgi:5-methylcytosine-specific restriction endonuclease McrA